MIDSENHVNSFAYQYIESVEEQYKAVLNGESYLVLSDQDLLNLIHYITGVKIVTSFILSDEKREVDAGFIWQIIEYMKGRK